MKHVIAGTAGHIDHGKTALVRALTGTDTDRLKEEKRRGISIDIGFAHLEPAPDLRVAVIDVPGHEKFIKNMLAGVGGIDFVVLVVAADESIKPQTREHFEICRLLRIPAGVVAITKADLVDEDTVGVTKLEVEEFVKDSFLENAAIIPVSAVSGFGLPELRAEMTRLARASVARSSDNLLRLPVDRSFVMPGFGTVVTGTVFDGTVRPEDEVELYPGGRSVRVRSVQVHGKNAKQASAGQRAALNLAGIDHEEIYRGSTIGAKAALSAGNVFDCTLQLLASAKPLKNRSPVHFHAGTAEVQAEIRTLSGASVLEPGTSVHARIVLRQPLLLLPGDRFIVRKFSPVVTIGGGEIIDNDPPRRLRRDALQERTSNLAKASFPERLGLLVAEAPVGLPVSTLVKRTGRPPASIVAELPESVLRFGDWLVDKEALASRLSRVRQILGDFHKSSPLQPGYSKEELRSRELPDVPVAVFEAVIASDRLVAVSGEHVRLASHKIALQTEERDAVARIEGAFLMAGLSVPALPEVLRSSGVDQVRARTLLQILLREKRLTRISEDLVFHESAVIALKQSLAEKKGQRFSVADFKDWTGVSRKYAIPLLEWLDRERITRRDADARVVL